VRVLICKAGPNTVLEAAGLQVPVAILPSGLPQEDWVVDLVEREALGVAFDAPHLLASWLERWAKGDLTLTSTHEKIAVFAARFLVGRSVVGDIRSAILEAIAADRPRGSLVTAQAAVVPARNLSSLS
jgi:UDP-N-acetylglucosamine:LPS N-acetylglucosamine transferase